MAIGGISFEVDGNTQSAQKSLDQLGARIQSLASKWDVSFDQINRSTQQSYNGMAKAAEAMRNFGNTATSSFDKASAAADRFSNRAGSVGEAAGRSQRAMQGATTNMAAQFQDIGVQAQMGASSMAIAIQQGTQLGAVLQSSAGGVRGLASALFSLLSPMNLLGIGIAFAAAELAKWVFGMMKAGEVRKVEDVLKDTATFFKDVGEAVPAVTNAIGNYQQATMSMMRGEALLRQAELVKTLANETKTAFDTILHMPQPDFSGDQYGVALQALQRLSDSAKQGAPDLEAFHKQIELILNSGEAFSQAQKDAALNLSYMVTEVMKANQEFPALQSIMLQFFNSVAQRKPDIAGMVSQLDNLAATTADKKLRDLADGLSKELQQARTVEQALAAISKAHDLLSGKVEELTALERQQAEAKAALAQKAKDYQTALQGLSEVVPKVQQTERQRLDTLYELAIASAADSKALNDATAAYTAGLTALNAYNVSLGQRLMTGQQALDMQMRLDVANATTAQGIRDVTAAWQLQSQQLSADQSMTTLVARMNELQATVPKTTLSLQEQLDQWYAQQTAMQLTAEQARIVDQTYLQLSGDIDKLHASLGPLGTLLEQSEGSFSGITAKVTELDGKFKAGEISINSYIYQLEGIRDAAGQSDPELAALIQRIIDVVNETYKIGPAAASNIGQINSLGAAMNTMAATAVAAAKTAQAAMAGIAAGVAAAGNWDAFLDPRGAVRKQRQSERDAQLRANALKNDFAANSAVVTKFNQVMAKQEADWAEQDKRAAEAAARVGKGGGGGGGGGGGVSEIEKSRTELENWANQMLDTVEPARVLARETEMLNKAVAAGLITDEQKIKVLDELKKKYGETATEAFDLQKTFQQMMTSWGDSVASSLADAIVNGEDLGDVFQDLIKQLMKMALEMLVLKPLMNSLMTAMGGISIPGFGAPVAAAAAAPASLYAANQNMLRGLPAPGMVGGRNATVAASSGTFNSTIGGITVNLNRGDSSVETSGGGQKAQAMASRIRDVIQDEVVRQSRPGGLLWPGGMRR